MRLSKMDSMALNKLTEQNGALQFYISKSLRVDCCNLDYSINTDTIIDIAPNILKSDVAGFYI